MVHVTPGITEKVTKQKKYLFQLFCQTTVSCPDDSETSILAGTGDCTEAEVAVLDEREGHTDPASFSVCPSF